MPAPDDAPADDGVLVTITRGSEPGTFMVYPGDEPEGGEPGDMSGDDVAAMGAEGDMPAGQEAVSVGEAMKMVVDILKGSGGGGDAEGAFTAGFGDGGGAPMAGIKTKPMMRGM